LADIVLDWGGENFTFPVSLVSVVWESEEESRYLPAGMKEEGKMDSRLKMSGMMDGGDSCPCQTPCRGRLCDPRNDEWGRGFG